jgi:hypothetical protein
MQAFLTQNREVGVWNLFLARLSNVACGCIALTCRRTRHLLRPERERLGDVFVQGLGFINAVAWALTADCQV